MAANNVVHKSVRLTYHSDLFKPECLLFYLQQKIASWKRASCRVFAFSERLFRTQLFINVWNWSYRFANFWIL